eukprot:TRINITY_DN3136_c0_g1_i1.p1 TRINITY_DN3136_c0_g1~~TRINITY_DN3136_c0_g1_i1.p1  ORF type:complete len:1175 (-),score=295.81 TRINITY_DN3136_c0_g1_i1:102-3452(-)
MGLPDVTPKRMREYLLRIIYCEMLGHSAAFGHIHAVNLAQKPSTMDKRIGYLAVTLLLHPSHELLILTVATLQRDLGSSNYLDICSALTALCRLLNTEIIPAVLPRVIQLLAHPQAIVRKKAIMAVHKCYLLNPSSTSDYRKQIDAVLFDKDAMVVPAALCIYFDMAQENPSELLPLVPSFVSILKQVTDARLSRDYDFHTVPAPWLQIKLLKILALLGADNQKASEGMYEILHDVIRKADKGVAAGYAVVYECVKTITTIHPNRILIETAANSISRFVTSENHNLKYLGITALGVIVSVNPKYAAQHQSVVIDCLDDPDDTIKRKTLDLLYRMTNPSNVVFITNNLLAYLRATSDAYIRSDLVSRITQLAERYAPSNSWFISTMTQVFEIGGELVRPEVSQNLLRLLAEGTGGEGDDAELHTFAVDTFLGMVKKDTVFNPVLLHVIAWTLGEYSYLASDASLEQVVDILLALLPHHTEGETRCWIVTAIMKIIAQLGFPPPSALATLKKFTASRDVDLMQRCHEILALTQNMATMRAVLPIDGSCEDLEMDDRLSFLNSFVQTALANGAAPYVPPEERGGLGENDLVVPTHSHNHSLRFEAYEAPVKQEVQLPLAPEPVLLTPQTASAPAATAATSEPPSLKGTLELSGVQRKWGKPVEPPAPAPAPAATSDPMDLFQGLSSVAASPASAPAPAPAPAPSGPSLPVSFTSQPAAVVIQPQPVYVPPPRTQAPDPSAARKAQMASALFGGAAAPASSSPAGIGKARTAAPPAQSTGTSDLLDLGLGPSPAPAPAPRPAVVHSIPPSSSAADDLLSLMTAPAPASAPSSASALFGSIIPGPQMSTPILPAAPVAAEPPAEILQRIQGCKLDDPVSQQLGSGVAIAATVRRIWHDDTLGFLFAFRNSTSQPLTNCTVEMTVSDSLALSRHAVPAGSLQQSSNYQSSRSWPQFPAHATIFEHAQCKFSALPRADISLTVSLGYRTTSVSPPVKVSFNVPITLVDFFRPVEMVTPVFGQNWVKMPHEKKLRVAGVSLGTMQKYMDKLSSKLHFHPVQIIGAEAIMSGRLSGLQHSILVHSKLIASPEGPAASKDVVDVMVRTPERLLSELAAQLVQTALQ